MLCIPLKQVDAEVFTEADVRVQTTVFKGLKHFWPSLNVIGMFILKTLALSFL